MKDSGIGSIDLIIILAYIIGILAIGLLSVRKKNDQHQLFFGRMEFQMANCRRCSFCFKYFDNTHGGSCGFWL